MSVKRFLIWSSDDPPCSVEQNNLCNFENEHHGEHPYVVI